MASVAIVINPNSRRTSSSLRSRVVRALANEHDVESYVTRARGDGTALTRRAIDDGATIIVTMGGDGTANEAALALEGGEAVLCPLPIGGTNVFSRALGWPSVPDAAVSLLCRAVDDLPSHTVGLRLWRIAAAGMSRLVCLNAGVGIDADVVAEVERRPIAKQRLGHGAYAAAAAIATEMTARRGSVMKLSSDGTAAPDLASVSLAIGGPYAYLGKTPLDLLPDAQFDGRLHWLGLAGGRRVDVARVGYSALYGRGTPEHAGVIRGIATDEVAISCTTPVRVQVDGEPLGSHRDIRFTPGGEVTVLTPNQGRDTQVSSPTER